MGDFDAIKKEREIKGLNKSINSRELVEFRSFILDTDLVDILACGWKFTWHKSDGRFMSRLDKFLIS